MPYTLPELEPKRSGWSATCSKSTNRSAACGPRPNRNRAHREKTAEAIQREVAKDVETMVRLIFTERCKTGQLDLEAVEMALRAAMHRAGAAVLTQLLRTTAPAKTAVPCDCGHPARYHRMRPKQLVTVLGRVDIERAYYLYPHCPRGQSPLEGDLDVEGVEYSPGMRRMMALVGSETSFEQAREQLQLLAGLEVTAKAVERQAEAIGAQITVGEQVEIRRAKQLDLPEVCAGSAAVIPHALALTALALAAGYALARSFRFQ